MTEITESPAPRARRDDATVAVGILTTMHDQSEGDARAAADPGLEITLLQHELDESRRENVRLRESLLAPPYSQLRLLIRRHPRLSGAAIKALNAVTGATSPKVHRKALALLQQQRDVRDVQNSGLFDSTWYRTTYPQVAESGMDPARHFLNVGASMGWDPGPRFSTRYYIDNNPRVAAELANPLLDYVRNGISRGAAIAPSTVETQGLAELTIQRRFPNLQPLRVYSSPGTTSPRISLITDSISAGSLFGGVGTALIFASLLARRLCRPLRVITRTEPPTPGNYKAVLEANGIAWEGDVDFIFSPREAQEGRLVDIADGDLFITTSWWTTWATRATLSAGDIIYIVQEDERRFYPEGDESIRCAEILEDPHIRYVTNSRALFEHLWGSKGTKNPRLMWFEPAFPAFLAPLDIATTGRRNFIFYARPNNVRNLYYRGLEAISAAIENAVLDPAEWEFFFIGKDLQPISLPRGVKPALLENLSWGRYQQVLRRMDLGLSLMASPHSSYPPLDMAAAGAAVVTNTFGKHRRSFDQYSSNIICCDPDLLSLTDGLARGVALAKDVDRRRANHHASTFATDWEAAFAHVCDLLATGQTSGGG